MILGVWKEHRNRSESRGSGTKFRRVIRRDGESLRSSLHIASVISEVRSKVIAENGDGETIWEIRGENR